MDIFFYKKKFNVIFVVWFYRDKCLCFSYINYLFLFNIDCIMKGCYNLILDLVN